MGKKPEKSKKSRSKKGGFFSKWVKILLLIMVALSIVPILQIAFYRVIDPPYTWLMLERKWLPDPGRKIDKLRHAPVDMQDISNKLVFAVIAGEDQLFTEHSGLDFNAIEKAISHNEKGKRKRGASTISQQTAKNAFLWESRTWLRKGLEVPLTFAIELLWGKRRILEVYLNTVELGPGVFGAEAAAQYWFGKSAKKLTLRQASLIAACLPAPRLSNPKKPSARLLNRAIWIEKQISQIDQKAIITKLSL